MEYITSNAVKSTAKWPLSQKKELNPKNNNTVRQEKIQRNSFPKNRIFFIMFFT